MAFHLIVRPQTEAIFSSKEGVPQELPFLRRKEGLRFFVSKIQKAEKEVLLR